MERLKLFDTFYYYIVIPNQNVQSTCEFHYRNMESLICLIKNLSHMTDYGLETSYELLVTHSNNAK